MRVDEKVIEEARRTFEETLAELLDELSDLDELSGWGIEERRRKVARIEEQAQRVHQAPTEVLDKLVRDAVQKLLS